MRTVEVTNWGNVNPLQFRSAVGGRTINLLVELDERLAAERGAMLAASGGESGRDFTPAEQRVFNHLGAAMRALGLAAMEAYEVAQENVVVEHDGGPDKIDGAPSNGVLA